jgi:hypothetical protein
MTWTTLTDPVAGNAIATAWGQGVNDNFDWLATPPAARAYNSADLAIANTTKTVLTFDSEVFDTASIHSTSSNTGRLTAPVAGLYHIEGHATFAADADGTRRLYCMLNDTTDIWITQVGPNASASIVLSAGFSFMYRLAAADWVSMWAYHAAGASLNIEHGGSYSPTFGMRWIGL